jgi:hypothetical protein
LKWYSDPGLTVQVNTGASYSPTLSGTTTYYVTETSGAGCVSSASPVTGTVLANPAAPPTTGASRCGSGVVTLSASGSGGTLKWYSDAGLTAQVNTGASYSPTLSGTTTFYVTETSGAGCVSLASPVTGTVNAISSAPTAGNNGPVCPGATLSLTASTVSGATYAWTGPNNFASSLQNPNISNATTAATGAYSVTATVNGCASAAGTTAATVGDTTPPTITCAGDVTVSANSGCTATSVVLGSPVTGDNCGVASVLNNGPAAYPLGTNSVTWTVTDGSGNTATCTQRVIVRDTTRPMIIGPADVIIHL